MFPEMDVTAISLLSAERGGSGPAANTGCFDVDDDFTLFGGRDFRFNDFEVVWGVCEDGEVSLLHVGHGRLMKAWGMTKFWGRPPPLVAVAAAHVDRNFDPWFGVERWAKNLELSRTNCLWRQKFLDFV
jgi:hypothetical protein